MRACKRRFARNLYLWSGQLLCKREAVTGKFVKVSVKTRDSTSGQHFNHFPFGVTSLECVIIK